MAKTRVAVVRDCPLTMTCDLPCGNRYETTPTEHSTPRNFEDGSRPRRLRMNPGARVRDAKYSVTVLR